MCPLSPPGAEAARLSQKIVSPLKGLERPLRITFNLSLTIMTRRLRLPDAGVRQVKQARHHRAPTSNTVLVPLSQRLTEAKTGAHAGAHLRRSPSLFCQLLS